METQDPKLSRAVVGWIVAAAALAAVGCNDSNNYRSPTDAPPPVRPSPVATQYAGDATILDNTGSIECGLGPDSSNPRRDVPWGLERTGDAIVLTYGDFMDGVTYAGTLEGPRFVAKLNFENQNAATCELREGWLAGTFADDFSSFDAQEAWYWGPRDHEAVSAWQWTARRF